MILREIFAKLGLDVDAQAFAKGAIAVEGVKAVVGKLVDKAEDLARQFVENVKATAEYAENIDGLAQSAGVTVEALQRVGKAAALEGMSIDQVSASLVMLTRSMSAAAAGEGDQAAAFRKLGVAVRDTNGQLRAGDQVFADLIAHFSELPDGVEKTHLAMSIFGRSGAQLIPVLNNGAEALEAMQQATVISPEQIRAGKEMVQVQRQLAAQTQSLWRGAIAPLLPAITDLLKQYLAWKKANNEVMKARIQAVLGGAIAVVRGLGAAFKFTLGVIQFFKDNWKAVLALVVGGVTAWALANTALVASFVATQAAGVASAVRVAAAWLAAAAPFVAIAAAVTAILLLFDDYRIYQEEIAAGRDGMRTVFGRLKHWTDDLFSDKGKKEVWWVEALRNAAWTVTHLDEVIKELRRDLEGLFGDLNVVRRLRDAAAAATGLQRAHTGDEPGWKWETTYKTKADGTRVPAGRRAVPIAGEAPELPTANTEAMAAPVPTAPPLAAGAGVYAPVQRNEIHVHAAPGMREADVADLVVQKVDEYWQGQMESAAAAGGG